MSLRLWRASVFVIALVIDSSYEKVTPVDSETFEIISHFQLLPQHLGFYFSQFNFTFNPTYLNLSVDLSIYSKNTKKTPVYYVPESRIEIFEDIPRLHVTNTEINAGIID